jgi:sulfoxide reductase heme-binding subunit YedZ
VIKPWAERNGRFSPLKAVVFVLLWLPAVGIVVRLMSGPTLARPAIEVNHEAGLWCIRLIMLALAVTPLRQILKWPKLVIVRRMIGVAAALYLALHFLAYVVDKGFDIPTVITEIVLRIYLTIGFCALVVIAALAVTSTDGMIRRLGGKRWQRLHRTVYLAAALGIIHYFLQMKLNVADPTVMFGLLLWLMGYRLVFWRGGVAWATATLPLLLLTLAAATLTALGEAAYFHVYRGIAPERILHAYESFARGPRPGWIVLFYGLGATGLGVARKLRDWVAPVKAAAAPGPR